ncbi:hypothetical protein BC937DRAFT_89386 [Endogone sp. FLAS-F59071]|nr:hypothetical protein BC937DRAFT_89386 [Endogone sp. FLAS-F59071]|eukprot:RUS17878.1 hypothetical protein BC937DRAFT_89386 [Endogone sp. FLAS-F59071]
MLGDSRKKYGHRIILGIDVQPFLLKRLGNGLARVESAIPLKWARVLVENAVVIEDIDKLEVVALADLVVIKVMRRGDLDGARAKGRVDENIVNNDGDTAVDEGMDDKLAMKVLWKRDCHVINDFSRNA